MITLKTLEIFKKYMRNRFSVKFGGQSGQGINSLGKFVSKALKELGYHTFAYREYPSIIQGGFSSYQVDFSLLDVLSPSKKCNILACIAKDALEEYIFSVSKKGIVFHSVEDFTFSNKALAYIKDMSIKVVYIDVLEVTKRLEAPTIMGNMVMLAGIWKVLGLDLKILQKIVIDYFATKEGVDLEAEKRCLKEGYSTKEIKEFSIKIPPSKSNQWKKSLVLTGNQALALGAISAGCRGYYAYPMTPATSILEILGDTYESTGILVKQAESEITAIQMAMGSMYMGARAFTATSGGGFDLMTESISCSGMAEIPLVVVLGQRAGSGTGVPTWSGASDLNAALYSGHGEFPRCVISTSDAIDNYELIQDAFNISETYQIPVIVLTEKHIAESIFNISKLPKPRPITRGLLSDGVKRYEITRTGISPRWIPKSGKKTYLTNSDEHNEYGISTEEESDIINMSEKRARKISFLKKNLPEPKYYGPKKPTTVFVGIGSSKNAVLDAMKQSKRKIGFLHYKYVYPLKYDKILQFSKQGAKIVLIENNQNGGFGKLIKTESNFFITNTLNKFDGRPFFVDDILEYLKQ